MVILVSSALASTSLRTNNSGFVTGPFSGKWFDYIVVIMMENHSINNTYDNGRHSCFGNCTYYTSLANSNGLAEEYTADGVMGGSAGDYIAITSGYGNLSQPCNNGPFASGCQLLQIPNIVDRLESAHLSWKAYMEDYPPSTSCNNGFTGNYEPNHNPFIYYADIQNNATRCSRIVSANSQVVSQSICWPTGLPRDDALINDLNSVSTAPNYMFLTPNRVDDNHDCDDVSVGNAWLNLVIPQILGSAVFTTKRAALFITFDEQGCTSGTCPTPVAPELYSVWASNSATPTTKLGFKSINPYTHYNPLRTIEDNWNLPPLIASTDGSARNMQEFFH
jgi:acid phosphatase